MTIILVQLVLPHIQQIYWRGYFKEGLKGKLRMYLEKISLDFEEQKKLVNKERTILHKINTIHILCRNCLLKHVTEGMIE